MSPTVGRIVIFTEGDYDGSSFGHGPTGPGTPGTNGTRDHPAIIARVWSDTCVNLIVFFDAVGAEARTSVMQLPDLPDGVVNNSGWRWPNISTAKAA